MSAGLHNQLSSANMTATVSCPGRTDAQAIVDDLRTLAWVVSPTEVARVVPSDPDDDHVLAAALSGAVDLIVSGDKRDLLALGSYQGIPIVTARQAMERIATSE